MNEGARIDRIKRIKGMDVGARIDQVCSTIADKCEKMYHFLPIQILSYSNFKADLTWKTPQSTR